jgi:hypothetical protein
MYVYIAVFSFILLGGFTACWCTHLDKKKRQAQAEAEAEADTHGFLQDRGSIEMQEIRLLHPYRQNRTTRDDEIESQVSPSSSSGDYGGEDDKDEAAAASQHRRGKEPLYG